MIEQATLRNAIAKIQCEKFYWKMMTCWFAIASILKWWF